jgi:hypothetical protein
MPAGGKDGEGDAPRIVAGMAASRLAESGVGTVGDRSTEVAGSFAVTIRQSVIETVATVTARFGNRVRCGRQPDGQNRSEMVPVNGTVSRCPPARPRALPTHCRIGTCSCASAARRYTGSDNREKADGNRHSEMDLRSDRFWV